MRPARTMKTKPGSTDPPTAPWRPCTPSRGPTSAVLTYAFSECARSGPRRRPTIWRTWTPIRSPRIGGSRLTCSRRRLPTLERWLSLLAEGGDALPGVLGHEDSRDRLSLQREPQVERGSVSERCHHFCPADRLGRSGRQLRAVLERRCPAGGCVVVELIHDAQLPGAFRGEGAGTGDQ